MEIFPPKMDRMKSSASFPPWDGRLCVGRSGLEVTHKVQLLFQEYGWNYDRSTNIRQKLESLSQFQSFDLALVYIGLST